MKKILNSQRIFDRRPLRVNGEYKYWIKVSPLARINPEEWLCAVFKKGKVSWTTEKCKDGFATPEEAYDWGYKQLDEE